MSLALTIFIGCHPEGPVRDPGDLPVGRFSAQVKVQASHVDSLGYMKQWIDTSTIFLEITRGNEWIWEEQKDDTCIYFKSVSEFRFERDTVFMSNTHGTAFKVESRNCLEVAYEYDIDSTMAIPIRSFTGDEVRIMGSELGMEREFLYRRI